jgi:hypothetical protein
LLFLLPLRHPTLFLLLPFDLVSKFSSLISLFIWFRLGLFNS